MRTSGTASPPLGLIEAKDEVEAENMAMDSIRNSEDLRGGIKNAADDMPMMFAEEIYEVDNFDDVESFEEGFAWYKEDETVEESEPDSVYEARIEMNNGTPGSR